jgi:heme-degrading monooxygenase HmoA
MIKHIVMWKLRGDDVATRARHALLVRSEFESLRGRIPGLLRLELGIDDSRVDYACDVVLYTEFASREALAAYADHPEHLRVRRALGDLRIARHQVDYEVADPHTTRDPSASLPAAAPAPGVL